MSFLLILAIGAMLGWLTSILTGSRTGHGLAANVGVGVAGALVSGAMASSVSILEGITLASLGATLVGTLLLLAVVNLVWRAAERRRDQTPSP
jgi:uncharacterized membrane protein YeaQ/YmgE (transglycosylase-associated protein family)